MGQPNLIYREFITTDTDFVESHSNYSSYPPHSHERIEMWYLIKGELDAYCDGQNVHLTPGSFFLVFPNQVHSYENISHDTLNISIIIHPSQLSHYKKLFAEKKPVSPICCPNDERLIWLLKFALEEFNNGTDEKVTNILITAFFGKLLSYYELVSSNASGSKISEVLAYCQTHFKENISLDKISTDLYISRSYLSYIFNKKLKISFSDYISSLRITEVLELIENNGHSISQAAYEAGFTGLSNFNRIFKKFFGVSPREYIANKFTPPKK